MKTKIYKVSDLKKLIRESSEEFKPVMGKNVEKDNKKNNEEAYKTATKRAKDYDGGVKETSNKLSEYPQTLNRGMQDLQYDGKVPEQFKKDQAARLKGYLSANDEKNHKNDETPVQRNEIPGMKERSKAFKKGRETQTKTGLTGRELNPQDVEELRDTMFENHAPKFKFKRTGFLNEEHMLSLIPDEARVENYKCIMEDARGVQFYVVWHADGKHEYLNKTKVNENFKKVKTIIGYKSEPIQTTNKQRVNENAMVENMMNKVRKLMNERKNGEVR